MAPRAVALTSFRPELLRAGDLPCSVKRLVTKLPHNVTFPWSDHPNSDVVRTIMVEQSNPRQRLLIEYSKVAAIHRLVRVEAEEAAPL